MKTSKLTNEQVKTRLHELPGWELREGKLHLEYKLAGFAESFGFMSTCAHVAQSPDHHPEWSNVFDRVVVHLTTDDAGGIRTLDFALVAEMENAAGSARGTSRRDPRARARDANASNRSRGQVSDLDEDQPGGR